MISRLSLSCRRPTWRAALITLTVLTGCQGSLRSWRRDEPSVRDFAVTPHPWDEPATHKGNNARGDARNAYAQQNRQANSGRGRANPYADPSASDRARFAPSDDVAEVGGEEELNFEREDAALKAIIADADPRHRAMLVLQYQALKNGRRAADELPEEEQSEEFVAETDDHEPASVAQPRAKLAQSKTNSPRISKNNRSSQPEVATASYSMSDDDQTVDNNVRQASATRRLEQDELGNPNTRSVDEPVHYNFSDTSEEYRPENRPSATGSNTRNSKGPVSKTPPGKSSTRPQEMKPPANSRDGRRTVKEPVANTGYQEQFPETPRAGGPREDTSSSSRKRNASQPYSEPNEPNDEADAHYTDQSQVIQASAESVVAANSEGTDSLNQPIIRPSSRSSSRNNANATANANSGEHVAAKSSPAQESAEEDWRELAQRTLRALDQEPVESSATAQLNHHVTKRILYVLLGQLDQALEPIPGLQPHEQEYFRHNLQALYNSIDPRGNPVLARRWPLVMDDHRTAMSHLGAVSNLEVKNAAFCSNVDGFGAVTKFPTNQFRPNQELLLYCEVENFVSEQIKDGYETKLRGNYEIVDANQTRVADFILPEEVDMCKRPRRDYFFVYRIYTPQNIAPGRYQLRLTIEDMKGNKFGQTSLDMQISGG